MCPTRSTARALVDAAGEPLHLLVNNASELGPSPLPPLAAYPLDELERVYRTNVLAPLRWRSWRCRGCPPAARILNITSDAAVEAYEGWGGYGSSKAALEQLSRVLAAEHPRLRVYAVDPGDMRTEMHQRRVPRRGHLGPPGAERERPGAARADRGRAAERPLLGRRARGGAGMSPVADASRSSPSRGAPGGSRPRPRLGSPPRGPPARRRAAGHGSSSFPTCSSRATCSSSTPRARGRPPSTGAARTAARSPSTSRPRPRGCAGRWLDRAAGRRSAAHGASG